MAKAGSWISSRSCINTIPRGQPTKPFFYFPTKASLKGNDLSLITKRSQRVSKRLVRISTSEGRWHGEWNSDYIFSLRDLQLEDLAEDAHRDTQVSINLSIHKVLASQWMEELSHLSPENVATASPHTAERLMQALKFGYYHQAGQKRCTDELPVLGGDDPSVIYVKPGFEADLHSLIQDTIRLTTSETCSNHVKNLNLNCSLWVNRMLLQLIEGGPDYWSSRSPEISIPIESKAPESL